MRLAYFSVNRQILADSFYQVTWVTGRSSFCLGCRLDLLNPAQRNSLTITLHLLEENLRQADAWLQQSGTQGILYHHTLRLPDDKKQIARQTIAAALQGIADLVQIFDLPRADEPIESKIAGAMAISWANLCDTHSEKLARYGAVDPRLSSRLDQHVESLAQQVSLLVSIFGNNTKG